ncbi:arsenical-resistance protein [Rhodotorula sp. JG-1b]|nr:arsenical-resistance protein [Rhodotorula sp. JG-1b]
MDWVQATTTVQPAPLHNPPPPASDSAPSQLSKELQDGPDEPEVVTVAPDKPALKRLAWLDKLLAVWIFLAMAVGIILGEFVPSTSVVLEKVKFVDVSLPLAIALIVMMWPILCRVSPTALVPLLRKRQLWQHLAFSVVINWIVSPLFMLGLAWAFLPDRPELREGLIVVGVARCIAMVLVWTDIADGDVDYCAVLVAVNSILQMVLFSPVALLFIKVFKAGGSDADSDFNISYSLVSKSVAAFLGIPFGAAMVTRGFFFVIRAQTFFERKFLPAVAPLSLIALLFTTLIIFAAQGHHVVESITDVLRVAAPLVVYFLGMFFGVLFVCRHFGVGYPRTTTQAFTAASNNFEIAQSVAIATWGANSSQALATTVGPLIEVPVLLGLAYALVWFRRRSHWDLAPPQRSDTEAPEAGLPVADRSPVPSIDKTPSYAGSRETIALEQEPVSTMSLKAT